MAEYIEREAARNAVLGFERYTGIAELPVEFAEAEIDKLPAADVAPVRHGRWIVNDYGDIWKCSACGVESYVDEDWRPTDDRAFKMHYCHYCGARMDGGEE